MNRREKIVAVVMSVVIVVWAGVYLPKVGKRPRLVPLAKSGPAHSSQGSPEAKKKSALSAEDVLDRAALRLKEEKPVLQNDPYRVFSPKAEVPSHPAGYLDLVLTGIIWEESAPAALINGEPVKVGDKIAGFTVEAIRPNEVVVKRGEERHSLRLPEEIKKK